MKDRPAFICAVYGLRKTFPAFLFGLAVIIVLTIYVNSDISVVHENDVLDRFVKKNRPTSDIMVKSGGKGSEEDQGDFSRSPGETPTTLQIQFWGGPFTTYDLRDGVYHCPAEKTTVRYTTAKSYDIVKKSDVVIFYQSMQWDHDQLARIRRKDQILAYWSRESPRHSEQADNLSVFNWTMTYRHTSDFFVPYGRLSSYNSSRNVDRKRPELKTNWAKGKTKLAAWVASNCQTSGFYQPSWPRQSFVQTLQKYMAIDTFGECGTMPCNDCIQNLNIYKFYLAFENDQCEDYITEKMWRNALVQGAVPIVFGAKRSDYERYIPKGSFIHINDFPTISSLVTYIKDIDKNDAMYNTFHEWRKDFYAEFLDGNHLMTAERLCEIVTKYKSSSGKYKDLTAWFHSSCQESPVPRDE